SSPLTASKSWWTSGCLSCTASSRPSSQTSSKRWSHSAADMVRRFSRALRPLARARAKTASPWRCVSSHARASLRPSRGGSSRCVAVSFVGSWVSLMAASLAEGAAEGRAERAAPEAPLRSRLCWTRQHQSKAKAASLSPLSPEAGERGKKNSNFGFVLQSLQECAHLLLVASRGCLLVVDLDADLFQPVLLHPQRADEAVAQFLFRWAVAQRLQRAARSLLLL